MIVWDVETSFATVATFSLHTEYTSHKNILSDWHMICGSWMELGNKKPSAVSLLDDPKRFKKDIHDDYYVVWRLREALKDADLLIHHNGDAFDIKKLNARLMYHGIKPLPQIQTLDTLKEVRKVAAIISNRLDYLGTFFHVGNKIHTDGELWLDVLRGDEKAIRKMVKYNKEDVSLLKRVYLKIRPYIKRHPMFPVRTAEYVCPVCDSLNVMKEGIKITRLGKRQRRHCKDCGSWSLDRDYIEKFKPAVVN